MRFTGIVPKDGAPRVIPATVADLEQLAQVTRGQPRQYESFKARSLKHNNWFHKLLDVVGDGIDMHPAVLKAELKYKCGLIKQIIPSVTFGTMVELKSTGFTPMRDEDEFTAFRKLAVEVLFRDYLPGVKRKAVYAQVEELTGERCPW